MCEVLIRTSGSDPESQERVVAGPATGRAGGHVALVLAAGVLFGPAGTAAALGPANATALGIGGLRLTVGAFALFLIMPLVGGRWSSLPRLWRRPPIWIMAAGAAGYQLFFFPAVQRSGVAVSTLVTVGAGPLFTGVLGWLALRQRPARAWMVATVIAIVGMILRSWGELRVGDGFGLLLAALAGFCGASYVVAAKVMLDRGGHVVELPGAAYLLGSVFLAPVLLTQPLGWLGAPSGLALALYLGVVTMALANVLQVRGMRGMGPGPAATLLLADPLTATVLGVAVLGETLTPISTVGLVLVLLGLLLQGRAVGATGTPPGDEQAPLPVL